MIGGFMKKLIVITILILPLLLFATDKYFMPIPVTSSNGRPINDATVGLYQADTLVYAMIYLENSAGEYYFTSQITQGVYDIYLNGTLWREGIYIEFGQQIVTAEISDTADVVRGDIMDTLRVNVDEIEDSVNVRGNLVAGALATGAVTGAKILDQTVDTEDIADNAVTTTQVDFLPLTSINIQNSTILDEDIVAGTITAAKLVISDLEDSLNARKNLEPKNLTWNFSIDSLIIERDSVHVLMYSPDSMTIDSIICLGNAVTSGDAGAIDVTLDFRHGKTLDPDDGGTAFGFSLNVTSTTTGSKYGASSIGIPAHQFIWVNFTGKVTVPKQLFVAFYGSEN